MLNHSFMLRVVEPPVDIYLTGILLAGNPWGPSEIYRKGELISIRKTAVRSATLQPNVLQFRKHP